MFDKDRVFYTSEDYTVRMEKIDGCEHYYIKYHGQSDSPEQEISIDVFKLYYVDFRKVFDKKRNEQRRHIEDGEIDGFIISGKLTIALSENEWIDRVDLETALKTCTPKQQKRLELHYAQGYSFTEIAKMENCDEAAVRRSIKAAMKKIKIFFQG